MSVRSIPHGRTARRLQWAHLPPHLRAEIERRIGTTVVSAASQDGGFTPGFASVLTGADGRLHFVKAASVKAQRVFAQAYREEARKLRALPPETPAPRLRWVHDDSEWVVLGLTHVPSRPPQRPWQVDELDAALDMLEVVVDTVTPPPPPLAGESIIEEYATWPGLWDQIRLSRPDLPHLEELAGLAARYGEVCGGDTLNHTDVRDDNVLITPEGRALLCDWNWPVVGAPWLDTVALLIGARADGLDVESVLASRRLTRDVPAEDVDVVLALMAGYFRHHADLPVPPASPYLRLAQAHQADTVLDWIAERRGWA